jgi:hypothetical protein
VFILDVIELLPPLGLNKYDTQRILPVKCYIDNSLLLQSYIRNFNTSLRSGPFQLAYADGDSRLPAEDVTKQGKGLMQWRMGTWSHFPLLSIFILLFVVPSHGFKLIGSVLPLRLCYRLGGAPCLSSLPLCLQPFAVDMVGLLPCHALR